MDKREGGAGDSAVSSPLAREAAAFFHFLVVAVDAASTSNAAVVETREADLSCMLKASGREIVLCGDWNIAHQAVDLKNWKSNQKNSGFLPEERAWLTRIFDDHGFVDVFRRLDQRPEQYTWWSARGQAWANNVGWRLDYQIATPGIAQTARAVAIHTASRFSDHAPLTVDYDFEI